MLQDPIGNEVAALKGVRLADAFALWRDWNIDVPPTGATGDHALDRKLAEAFRSLTSLPTADLRFAWIEREVFSTNDFMPAHAPPDSYRDTLMRWWLELFDTD